MQITDMLNQYNRNLAGGVEMQSGTQGIKQVMSSLQQMAVGNVFEGSINSIEDGVVTLGLSDGKTIQARLDSHVSVRLGDSMFFQVKSNNGEQIAIRPFSNGIASNPTLIHALEAANLQINGKMLTMVNSMMEQSMAIDKQSLMQMARLVMSNDGMNPTTIVQMAKLGIPITEEMAVQFENYKSDQHAILKDMETMMRELPGKLASGNMTIEQAIDFNRQMIAIFIGDNMHSEDGINMQNTELLQQNDAADAVFATEDGSVVVQKGENLSQATEGDFIVQNHAANAGEKAQQPQGYSEAALGQLFGDKNIRLNPEATAKELLQLLNQTFSTNDPAMKTALSELLTSREYRSLIKNVIKEQWFLRPQDLQTENKVNELYSRLNRQLEQMENVLKSFGQNNSQLSDTAANVRSNIQFMNQINQTYAYVQLPLKMSGQNAHSDLYVYTDRRRVHKEDGEFTAFLHLDLDNLGSTDVSIRLHQKNVTTNFYLADDLSYQLIMEHMDILEERLAKKGYSAKIQVINQEKKVNFVEELLKKDQPLAGGMVHRYSFDVRA